MTKKNIQISVDENTHKNLRDRDLNISAICDSALQKEMYPGKKDAPEEALMLKCTQCFKSIDYGFMCENNTKMFLCQECQDNWSHTKCLHDKLGTHSHIRVPGFDGQNSELVNKIDSAPVSD